MTNSNNQYQNNDATKELAKKGAQIAGRAGKRALKKAGAKVTRKLGQVVLKSLAKGILAKTAPIWGSALAIMLLVVIIFAILIPDFSTDVIDKKDDAFTEKIGEYIEIGMELGIEPRWLVAFDMVIYDNDRLLDKNTSENAYHFFRMSYERYEPQEPICISFDEAGLCSETTTPPDIILESAELEGKEAIQKFLKSKKQNPEKLVASLNNLRGQQNTRVEIFPIYPDIALENANFTEEQKEYFNDILESELLEEEYPELTGFGGGFIFGGGAYCSPTKEINQIQWDSAFSTAGVLSDKGPVIIEKSSKYGIDPVLFATIAFHESTYGKSNAIREKNNPGGLMNPNGSGLYVFATLDDGLEAMARTLHNRIIKDGLTTIERLGSVYAPIGATNDPTGLNNHWVPAVSRISSSLGGLTMNCESYSNGFDIVFDGDVSELGKVVTTSGFKWIGNSRYVLGGGRNQSDVDRGIFDCSSFVHWAYQEAGITLGHRSGVTTKTLNKMGTQIPFSQIQPGDLIFFDSAGKDGHVGIWIGNGKWIGSQGSTGVAIVHQATNSYWISNFSGHVRRLL